MKSLKERLAKGAETLDILERRRNETKSPHLGYDYERSIVDLELHEIEREIVANPGALERFLVPKKSPFPHA